MVSGYDELQVKVRTVQSIVDIPDLIISHGQRLVFMALIVFVVLSLYRPLSWWDIDNERNPTLGISGHKERHVLADQE